MWLLPLVPLPDSAADCGLPVALSVTVRTPERDPVAVGVKSTTIEQEAPAATLDPQVLFCEKSPPLVPRTAILETVTAEVPELVSVTVWATLATSRDSFPNDTLEGESVTPEETPVPVSAADCGLPAPSSVMASVPERAPALTGLKVMLTVQEAFAASEVPQLLVSAKLVAFDPKMAMPLTVSAELPEFLMVAVERSWLSQPPDSRRRRSRVKRSRSWKSRCRRVPPFAGFRRRHR